jgi:hypothetical protein
MRKDDVKVCVDSAFSHAFSRKMSLLDSSPSTTRFSKNRKYIKD